MGRRALLILPVVLAGCVTNPETGESIPVWSDPTAQEAVKEGVDTTVDALFSNGDLTLVGVIGALGAGALAGWKYYAKKRSK